MKGRERSLNGEGSIKCGGTDKAKVSRQDQRASLTQRVTENYFWHVVLNRDWLNRAADKFGDQELFCCSSCSCFCVSTTTIAYNMNTSHNRRFLIFKDHTITTDSDFARTVLQSSSKDLLPAPPTGCFAVLPSLAPSRSPYPAVSTRALTTATPAAAT
jgi:hypothetical protein